jgi:hypothetical protein
MKQSSGWFFPEPSFDIVQNAIHITHEIGNVVMADIIVARVMAMIALIIEDKVVLISQQSPKGIIGINRKAVAVCEDEPGPFGIAMATKAYNSAVLHSEIYGFDRCRYGEFSHAVLIA